LASWPIILVHCLRDYVRQRPSQMLMQDCPSLCPDPVSPSVSVPVVMLEYRKAEPKNPIEESTASSRR
jgi:hypothetical protein